MTFTLTMETDNAAFGDDPAAEISRLLREAARRVELGILDSPLLDANGNRVGRFEGVPVE